MLQTRRQSVQFRQEHCSGGNKVVRIPEPYTGSITDEVFTLQDVPTSESLTKLLNAEGIDTSDWGKGNTKEVSKFWKEIKLDEAGFEVWKTPEGKRLPVRVTHVLRAKVSSPEQYARGIFLFNTWQQYGDGRRRTRNGLLSEKLQMSEMPLELNLHEVCRRAVTEEEMQRVVDAQTHIGPDSPAPVYDANYQCPLEVVDEVFVDHTVEIEASKSYPGLLTVYHLYTVDIICTGLPTLNFNTLEFDGPDKEGKRGLKYIHAWVWLKWDSIQRYLLEGSVMKEKVVKGTFKNGQELQGWLAQFDMDLQEWGKGALKSVSDLFDEVEKEQTQLEHWGRQDGVPILMRVVHVVQVKLTSLEALAKDQFLIQESRQRGNGLVVPANRLMSQKLDTSRLPFDLKIFQQRATQAVQDAIQYIVDVHFYMDASSPPKEKDMARADLKILEVDFDSYRYSMENSPSYKDIATMYHLYTVSAVCEGLPSQDFGSVSFSNGKPEAAYVWRWVTWQHTLDILHARANQLMDRDGLRKEELSKTHSMGVECLDAMKDSLGRLSKKNSKDADFNLLTQLVSEMEGKVLHTLREMSSGPAADTVSATDRLPPSMISTMADKKLITDDFLHEVRKNRGSRTSRHVSSGSAPDAGTASYPVGSSEGAGTASYPVCSSEGAGVAPSWTEWLTSWSCSANSP